METLQRAQFVFDDELMESLDAGDVPHSVLQEIERLVLAEANGHAPVAEDASPTSGLEAAEYIHSLGTHNLPNQTRVHKHGPFDFRFETRSQRVKVSVRFRHPTMSTFVNHAKNCVAAAAVSSVITAAATNSPNAGLAIFKPAWKACMMNKVGNVIANQVQVAILTEIITGNWSGH
jgi:hypothetical protein